MPVDLAAIITAKQIFNQLSAIGIAAFLLRHTAFPAWISDRAVRRRRIRGLVFHTVFVLSTVPVALVGIGISLLLRAYADRKDRDVLTSTSYQLAQQLDLFLEAQESAVSGVARTLGRSTHDAGILLDEVRKAYPAFLTMLITDAEGNIAHIASVDPLASSGAAQVSNQEYFRRARDDKRLFVSGAFHRRGLGRNVLMTISAPIHDAAGNFAGVVEGSIEVHEVARHIAGRQRTDKVELIFADAGGRVIFADTRSPLLPLASLHYLPQGQLLNCSPAPQLQQFNQVAGSSGETRYVACATRGARGGLVVIAQRPLLAAYDGSGWIFALFGGVAISTLGAAAFVARSAHRRLSAPLEYFAKSTNRLAALRTVEPIEGGQEDAPSEVRIVFGAFNQLAVRLQGSYAMLRKTNEELDQRVTERTVEAEAARAQAEAASQSKSDFLAMTSHEIRTPLNAIIGLADSLAVSARDPVAAERLGTIRSSGQRLLTVVNDLLDLAKVEAGKLDLHLAPVDLAALCSDLQRLFALRAREQGVTFEVVQPEPGAWWFETDADRLQQVLINLVGNALKFTPRGGRISLQIERHEGSAGRTTLRFAVIDTGPGIALEQQAELFQPFVQLPGAAQCGVPSTGLGLSISRRLVTLFGGELAVRSEVGRGAEFYFTIEVAPVPPPPVANREPERTTDKLRVLAADDNMANQEVLRALLEGRCTQLVVVDGAGSAIAELMQTEFDVALIDLEMADADGCSVSRAVRNWTGDEASRSCRLIALSAHRKESVWARCVASGFDDYLEKPIDRAQLLRALHDQDAPVLALSTT